LPIHAVRVHTCLAGTPFDPQPCSRVSRKVPSPAMVQGDLRSLYTGPLSTSAPPPRAHVGEGGAQSSSVRRNHVYVHGTYPCVLSVVFPPTTLSSLSCVPPPTRLSPHALTVLCHGHTHVVGVRPRPLRGLSLTLVSPSVAISTKPLGFETHTVSAHPRERPVVSER